MRIEVNIDGTITEHEDAPVTERSQEEIEFETLQAKIQEADVYLAQTDWVETYKIRHDLGLELIPEDSSKWLVINKREEYKLFLRTLEGVN